MTKSKKYINETSNHQVSDMPMVNSELSAIQQTSKLADLFNEVEAAIDTFSYGEAESKLNDILKMNSKDTKALELLSGVFIEQMKWTEAENLLKYCIELSPGVGYSKYFSMGQLCEGTEALDYYKKGIEIIEKELEDSENMEPSKETSKKSLRRSLSDAYCSVAEIFMTDCCDEDDAEKECSEAVAASIKSDPTNPDAYQCQANFHLIKQETEDAKDALAKSLSLWLPKYETIRDNELSESAAESDQQSTIPSYDSRLKTSKLLIELKMYDEAVKILDGLMEEDNEVFDIWYLLGLSNYLQGDEFKKNAHYYLRKAKEIHTKLGTGDDESVIKVDQLLEELSSSHPISDEEEVEDEESQWTTDSESEENKMET